MKVRVRERLTRGTGLSSAPSSTESLATRVSLVLQSLGAVAPDCPHCSLCWNSGPLLWTLESKANRSKVKGKAM